MARKMEITAVDLTHSSSIPWIADVYSIATNARNANIANNQTGYIGEFEEIDDHRNGKVVVQLNGRLNKTGVISPRYNVALSDMEKWVVKLLPSRQFGYIVLTTSSGIMDHEEARRKHVSGKIIGFFY
jgi:ribosomal protein S8